MLQYFNLVLIAKRKPPYAYLKGMKDVIIKMTSTSFCKDYNLIEGARIVFIIISLLKRNWIFHSFQTKSLHNYLKVDEMKGNRFLHLCRTNTTRNIASIFLINGMQIFITYPISIGQNKSII